MKYFIIQPSEKVKPFVRLFLVSENKIKGEPYNYCNMAGGYTKLLFHYKDGFKEIDQAKLLCIENISLFY
jgi:hypothetical protein